MFLFWLDEQYINKTFRYPEYLFFTAVIMISFIFVRKIKQFGTVKIELALLFYIYISIIDSRYICRIIIAKIKINDSKYKMRDSIESLII